jgi:hypothetical protein
MTRRTSIIRCALAAIALLVSWLTVAPFAANAAKDGTVQELAPDPNHCKGDGQPYRGVYCNKNHDPGGPTGCFVSPCEAHAVGAYECMHVDSCD